MLKFNLIAAIDNNGLIGIREYDVDTLPWPYIKEDSQFFRQKVTSVSDNLLCNALIVGFNTFLTIPSLEKTSASKASSTHPLMMWTRWTPA